MLDGWLRSLVWGCFSHPISSIHLTSPYPVHLTSLLFTFHLSHSLPISSASHSPPVFPFHLPRSSPICPIHLPPPHPIHPHLSHSSHLSHSPTISFASHSSLVSLIHLPSPPHPIHFPSPPCPSHSPLSSVWFRCAWSGCGAGQGARSRASSWNTCSSSMPSTSSGWWRRARSECDPIPWCWPRHTDRSWG